MSNLRSTLIGTLGLVCSLGCGKDHGSFSDAGVHMPGIGTADSGGQPFHIDRSDNSDVGTGNPLDYGDPNLWVCRPGIDINPCYGEHGELDATELLPDGTTQLVKHTRAKDPKFDCFYIYPTVYLEGSGNRTDLNDITYVLDALMAQGARLSELCEVYAPLYRQVVIQPNVATNMLRDGGSTPGGETDAEGGASAGLLSGPEAALALGDVRNAFAYYLEHLSHGRKFVLMGHSQGSGMLIGLMQNDVDSNPDVRARMISALLLGGGSTVASGKKMGGSFQNIPTCSEPGDTGCVVGYSSFDSQTPPDASALFGRAAPGFQVTCTDPGSLNGNPGPYKGSYFPTHLANPLLVPSNPHMPDPGTAFLLYRDVFRGECVNQNGESYLNITLLEKPDDPRGVPPYHSSVEAIGFGLHLVDWALPMQDIIEAVGKQAAAAIR